MKKLYFATTNEGKLKEARDILDLEIDSTSLEVDEIQSLDPIEVAVKKAHSYFEKLRKPVFIEDVSLGFNTFGRLPGPYINDFFKELGNDGLIELMENQKDRSAIAQTTIVYVDKMGKMHVFEGVLNGRISEKAKGENGFGWDPIFIPEKADKTFGEMELKEKNKYSMRAKALKSFKNWLQKSEK